MTKKAFIALILTVVFSITLIVTPYKAVGGWVDDWLQNHTAHTPGYFEGQKRGYMTGGSFSARWRTGSDYLVTIEPPRLKTGCGGIDIFLGGFSFLNFEYLVQKLQRMLAAAPAVAFDMALATLCEKCSAALKDMKSIIDALNSLQLDECAAAKALVANVLPESVVSKEIKTEAEENFLSSSGINNLRYAISKARKSTGGVPQAQDVEMTQDCHNDLKDIFLKNNETVLGAIAKKRNIPIQYIELARGFVGDVYIQHQEGGKSITAIRLAPCQENTSDSVNNFIGGKAKAHRGTLSNDACYEINDTNANLRNWTSNKIIGIITKIKRGNMSLTEDERSFLDIMPFPLLTVLQAAVRSGAENSIIEPVITLSSKAYAYGLMSDLYRLTYESLYKAEQVMKSNATYKEKCQTGLLTEPVRHTEAVKTNVENLLNSLRNDYARLATEMTAVQSVVNNYMKLNDVLKEELSKKFGKAVTLRVLELR